MQQILTKTVREIALEAPGTTRVFEEYKIDYCCHGDTLFTEACMKIGADPAVVMRKIDSVLDSEDPGEEQKFSGLSLSQLVDHIIDTHHYFTRSEIERLRPLMSKVANRHGDHHLFLAVLERLFNDLCSDLEPHMAKEETVLFPYIREMERNAVLHLSGSAPPFGTVKNPVKMMRIEHEGVGELLSKMRSVTDGYKLPADACPSFTALFHRLETLERDLHQHIHLENNLLFHKATELEEAAISMHAV